ncbi:hypothetical protein NQ318_003741 [Aromia moschata]|uniref:Integrase catalytic domain-containing protein n=1 Tax=Aromia moschata TaxID=1265417 RepID=A0AAV8XHT8_9CUCU|nr:hypothetical protein NQ318_003741 [Aromia moschata]
MLTPAGPGGNARHRESKRRERRAERCPETHGSRSRHETRTRPRENSTVNEDRDRIQKLEEMVERLLRRDSHSSDRNSTMVRMTVKADCIPEFAPGNPNLTSTKWVDKIEQLAQINQWDEHLRIYHMQSRLTGLARTWYDNLPTYNYSWTEWKALIKRTFPDHHDFSATLRKLVNRSKLATETMTQYYFAKLELLQACEITGTKAVSCLIDGIGDRALQNSAKAGRYETPEHLYEKFLSTLADDNVIDTEDDKKGYVDTGCGLVTIRQSDAESLQLMYVSSKKILRGYGGSVIPVLGEANAVLEVDLIQASVEVVVVSDSVQSVPLMIGQTFINQSDVTVVIKDNRLRLFKSCLAALPEIEQLSPRKIPLWSKDAVVIPPNTIGFIEVYGPDDCNGEVYVDEVNSSEPGSEYAILSCITTIRGGVISLRNLSPTDMAIQQSKLLVRGRPCQPETLHQGVSVLHVDRCKQPGYLHPIEKFDTPMHTLHMDHLGPFVPSKRKNTHIITAIDGFTKFLFIKAVRSTKVGPVLTFLDEVINTFGVPRRLICDRGSCFTSKSFAEYCQRLGIKVNYNATATPRANGQAERYNRTILASLASTSDDERRWDDTLQQIRWGINTTINKTTNKTPCELLMGFQPRQANDAYLSAEVCSTKRDENLLETRATTSKRIQSLQSRQKQRYDAKRKAPNTYVVGQHVLIRKTIGTNDGKSRKLLPKFSGPYVITKILDHDRYVVKDLPGSTKSQKPYEGVIAIDKLKPYDTALESDDENITDDDNNSEHETH